ncbi:hypothetical protein HTY54_00190 [Escherichia coli]|nr:hypothetical protein [Escherichia coli]
MKKPGARMNNLQRQDGIFGESWIDSPQISILMESKINVQELIELHPRRVLFYFPGRNRTISIILHP